MDEIVVKEIYFTNTAINVRGNNVQDAQIRMENRLRAKKKPNVTKKGWRKFFESDFYFLAPKCQNNVQNSCVSPNFRPNFSFCFN